MSDHRLEATLTEAGAEALDLAGVPAGAQLPDGLPAGLELTYTLSLTAFEPRVEFPRSFARSRREETLEVVDSQPAQIRKLTGTA